MTFIFCLDYGMLCPQHFNLSESHYSARPLHPHFVVFLAFILFAFIARLLNFRYMNVSCSLRLNFTLLVVVMFFSKCYTIIFLKYNSHGAISVWKHHREVCAIFL